MKCIPLAPESAFFVLLIMFAMWLKIESERPKYRSDYRYEKAFGAFYKLHTAAVDWFRARIRCEAEGAELTVPDTLDEADSIPLLVSSIHTKFDGVYIGMHDLFSERSFVTVRGSTVQDSILDLLWELKQPLHSGGRCVAMRRNGHLFVNPCTNPLPFVCKLKANQVAYYKECDTFDPHWILGPNNTCYITHEERQTWHDAYSTCLSAGGYLAIPNSRDEAEYLRDVFKHVDQYKTPGDFAFLGYSDLFQRFHYKSVHGDSIEKGNLDWDFQCPEKSNTGKQNLRCGGLRRSGLLAAGDCERPAMFFCEKPANGTVIQRNILRAATGNKGFSHKYKTKTNSVEYIDLFK